MAFVQVRKFGDKQKSTQFDFIDRKPVVDKYVQKRLESIAKKKAEIEKLKQEKQKTPKK